MKKAAARVFFVVSNRAGPQRRATLTIPFLICMTLVLYVFLPHVLADANSGVDSRVAVLESEMSELTWEVRGMLLALCTIAFEIVRNWISALSKKP